MSGTDGSSKYLPKIHEVFFNEKMYHAAIRQQQISAVQEKKDKYPMLHLESRGQDIIKSEVTTMIDVK